jgi:hypothetical protein
LTYLRKFKKPEGILAPRIIIIEAFEFDIEYKEGKKQLNATSLSRKIKRPCKIANYQECVSTFKKSRMTRNNSKYVSM